MLEANSQNAAAEAVAPTTPSGARPHWRLHQDELFAAVNQGEVKGALVRGGTVTMLAQFARLVLQTVAMMIIARVLTPEDFGLQGYVVAVTGVISLFRDVGLSMATVQRPHITHEETSTLFWINVAVGAALMLITPITTHKA